MNRDLHNNDAYNWQALHQEMATTKEQRTCKSLFGCLDMLQSWMKIKQREFDDSTYTICNTIKLNAVETEKENSDQTSDILCTKVQGGKKVNPNDNQSQSVVIT